MVAAREMAVKEMTMREIVVREMAVKDGGGYRGTMRGTSRFIYRFNSRFIYRGASGKLGAGHWKVNDGQYQSRPLISEEKNRIQKNHIR